MVTGLNSTDDFLPIVWIHFELVDHSKDTSDYLSIEECQIGQICEGAISTGNSQTKINVHSPQEYAGAISVEV